MRFPTSRVAAVSVLLTLFALAVLSLSLRDKLLYPLSLLEFRLPATSARPACAPKLAAHRGYGRGEKARENRWESIQEAIQAGIEGIEVDFQFLEDGIVLEHEPLVFQEAATLIEYEKQTGRTAFTLNEFLKNHAGHFKFVFYDLKGIHAKDPRILWTDLPFDKERDFLIGRNCTALAELSRHFGLRASCERHGLIGNLLMSFDFLSIDYRRINVLHTNLIPLLDFPVLIWTFENRATLRTECPMATEYALLTRFQDI